MFSATARSRCSSLEKPNSLKTRESRPSMAWASPARAKMLWSIVPKSGKGVVLDMISPYLCSSNEVRTPIKDSRL